MRAHVVSIIALGSVLSAGAQSLPTPALEARAPLPKRATLRKPDGDYKLVVKFRDEIKARVDAAAELSSAAGLAVDDAVRIAARHGATFQPLLRLSGEYLAGLEERAAAHSNRAQPDLAGMFEVRAVDATIERLAAELNALDSIEFVHFKRVNVVPPCNDIAPATNNFAAGQTYRGADPGLNFTAAAALGNITGTGMNLSNVEYAFILGHEDLCNITVEAGQTFNPANLMRGDHNHGAATLGQLVALNNTYGCTGLVPNTAVFFFPESSAQEGWRRESAIAAAMGPHLFVGDVLMLEMQTSHPDDPNFLVPAEFDPDVWLLTRNAVDSGLVVVAAAGNGNQNLDDPNRYEDYIDLGHSGAILVGAGDGSAAHRKMGFSSFGSRIDVQAWGMNVTTLGYGGLFDPNSAGNPNDPNDPNVSDPNFHRQRYTSGFSGTSSATPMIAACAVGIQGHILTRFGGALSAARVRDALVDTGLAQTGGGGNIGPLPDMVAAVRDSERAWVQAGYSGAEIGSRSRPFNTLGEGIANAFTGGTVMLKSAVYHDRRVINKRLKINASGGSSTIGN